MKERTTIINPDIQEFIIPNTNIKFNKKNLGNRKKSLRNENSEEPYKMGLLPDKRSRSVFDL